ncbi:MAG TPA: hypothetical protein VNM92_13430 [Thermoanaerobaculia bacterium]|nr:hypothetical protein [Thermoanaerobaculia bacterium]
MRWRHPAERSPARHKLALFKLTAFLSAVMQGSPQPREENFVFVLDEEQSATECYARGFALLTIVTAYISFFFQQLIPSIGFPTAFASGLAAAWVALNTVFLLMGVPLEMVRRAGLIELRQMGSIQTVTIDILVMLASVWAYVQDGWIHYAGVLWLSVIVCNGLAQVLVLLLGSRIREVEARLGGNEFVN